MPPTFETLSRWRTRACLALGRVHRAGERLDRRLATAPGDAWALRTRSHLLAQRGRDAEALADARRVVGLPGPARAADWFNFGYLLERAGEPAEAERAFLRALELEPRLDRAWYGLGLARIRQHRLDAAVEALTRSTELQPMSPAGWYQLARVHAERARPALAREIIAHLKGFEPRVAAQLERETGLGTS